MMLCNIYWSEACFYRQWTYTTGQSAFKGIGTVKRSAMTCSLEQMGSTAKSGASLSLLRRTPVCDVTLDTIIGSFMFEI